MSCQVCWRTFHLMVSSQNVLSTWRDEPHFTGHVRTKSHECFSDHWLGHGRSHANPPQGPNLMPPIPISGLTKKGSSVQNKRWSMGSTTWSYFCSDRVQSQLSRQPGIGYPVATDIRWKMRYNLRWKLWIVIVKFYCVFGSSSKISYEIGTAKGYTTINCTFR